MLKKFFGLDKISRQQDRQAELYRNLIRHEAKLGGELFGPIPHGRRREFFCLDEHTWVWHEEWKDESGQRHIQTTRYDIRPNQILKSQGDHYQPVSEAEGRKLLDAMREYRSRISTEIYNFAH